VPLPESRQIAAPTAIITPPPADTSGVIPGWNPTILDGGEPSPTAQPATGTPATPALSLNDVAKQVFKQDFDSLGKAAKEFVQQALDKYNRAAQPTPAAPTVDQPTTVTAPAPQAAAPEATAPIQPAIPDPTAQVGGGGPVRPPLATPESTAPPASFLDQENTGLQIPQVVANRAAKAQRFINRLGGTQNLPRTQAEWEKLAADIGEKVPSAETQAQITLGLNKLMRAGAEKPGTLPVPDPTQVPSWVKNAKDPIKALKAAEKLREAMQ
jgi:hypothetical protein